MNKDLITVNFRHKLTFKSVTLQNLLIEVKIIDYYLLSAMNGRAIVLTQNFSCKSLIPVRKYYAE